MAARATAARCATPKAPRAASYTTTRGTALAVSGTVPGEGLEANRTCRADATAGAPAHGAPRRRMASAFPSRSECEQAAPVREPVAAIVSPVASTSADVREQLHLRRPGRERAQPDRRPYPRRAGRRQGPG